MYAHNVVSYIEPVSAKITVKRSWNYSITIVNVVYFLPKGLYSFISIFACMGNTSKQHYKTQICTYPTKFRKLSSKFLTLSTSIM